jgi:alanine racemase
MSDILAIGALEAAAELAVAVPGALSVVGFDDGPAAEHATPPLTTVAQPNEEKGRLAARWLMEDIERGAGPASRREEILPTQLVVRDSTAPPRGS